MKKVLIRKPKKVLEEPTEISLCHRCEYRARALETGRGPRFECSEKISYQSCYMYCPVKPVILKPVLGDKRPIGSLWAISPRQYVLGVLEGDLKVKVGKDLSNVSYWVPSKKKVLRKKKVTKPTTEQK